MRTDNIRETLFRGIRKDTHEWVYGFYGEYFNGKKNIPCISIVDTRVITGSLCYEVIPETVGQYTGLTDKNGRKIFEGDIIESHFDEIFPDLATTLIVVWNDYGWFGRDMEGNVDSLEQKWVSDFFEIIGNIHDNPLEVSGNNG